MKIIFKNIKLSMLFYSILLIVGLTGCGYYNKYRNINYTYVNDILYNPIYHASYINEQEFDIWDLIDLNFPFIHGRISEVNYGDNKAYLFGSFYFTDWLRPPLYDEVRMAMLRADVFVFEYDRR